jgi:hypothetical protein
MLKHETAIAICKVQQIFSFCDKNTLNIRNKQRHENVMILFNKIIFPGVNITNILLAAFFLMKVLQEAFLYLHFRFCNFFGARIMAQNQLLNCW